MASLSPSPAQLLLARTPPTPSTAAATSLSTSSRPRSSHHNPRSSTSFANPDNDPGNGSSQYCRTPITLNPPLAIHPTFSPCARNPGTVKVLVEGAVYYVHRDILVFGSSFFEALLNGDWAETASVAAPSFVGGSDGLGMPERRWSRYTAGASPHRQQQPVQRFESSTATSTDLLAQTDSLSSSPLPEALLESDLAPDQPIPEIVQQEEKASDNITLATSFVEEMHEMGVEIQTVDIDNQQGEGPELVGEKTVYEDLRKRVEARVVLREEKAAAFQDLLYFLYPHLDCIIHWNNVGELMTMSSKFDIPLLRSRCISFLMASAAGKPIMAMHLAEVHLLSEVYREASRFLLDSWSVWESSDLSILTEGTLLKLEKRRNWFLERLLKLGMLNTARDYVCCPTCPDPASCARQLEEKWRSAWSSVFRYASSPTPSPSYIFKSLRMLEPSLTSPPLHLNNTSCQNHARAWIADLFDRMFSLGGSVNLGQRNFPLTSSAANRAPLIDPASNKKYFLYVDYKSPVI